MLYVREVDAEQFNVNQPWPRPVREAAYPKYVVRVSDHSHEAINDGDWVVWPADARKVSLKHDYRLDEHGEPVYPRVVNGAYFKRTYKEKK